MLLKAAHFLLTSIAVLTVQVSAQQLPSKRDQAPGFYKATLGLFQVVALSDGSAPRQMDQILSEPSIVRRELAKSHEAEPINLSINAYLIDTGSHVVLVDTGAGELFGPTSGFLLQNLAAAGYRVEQIDAILLTHIHADHSGGLTVGKQMQFPNAQVYVDARDIDHWFSKSEEENAPVAMRKTFQQSQQTVGPYLDAKRVVTIKDGTKVLPGITAMSEPGHTPGHTAYLVESAGHKLLLWGDIVHSAVQFSHPGITVEYDVKPDKAVLTRKALLKMVASEDLVVGSAHISFPGFGHVRKSGNGYVWVPLPYNSLVGELDPK